MLQCRLVANGGVSKVDGASQQNGPGIRSSISRPKQDNSPLLHDKRDRLPERERVTLKAINKYVLRLTALYSENFLLFLHLGYILS